MSESACIQRVFENTITQVLLEEFSLNTFLSARRASLLTPIWTWRSHIGMLLDLKISARHLHISSTRWRERVHRREFRREFILTLNKEQLETPPWGTPFSCTWTFQSAQPTYTTCSFRQVTGKSVQHVTWYTKGFKVSKDAVAPFGIICLFNNKKYCHAILAMYVDIFDVELQCNQLIIGALSRP